MRGKSLHIDQDMALRYLYSSQKHWQRHESQLTANEKGEEDVGMETELGDMETLQIHPTQKVRKPQNCRRRAHADVYAVGVRRLGELLLSMAYEETGSCSTLDNWHSQTRYQ